MLYGQILIKEAELGPVTNFLNDHQAAIAGGLGGGLISGGAAYLSADNNKLKKGLLGAIPGALAGGYIGNKYDNSNWLFPLISKKDHDASEAAWQEGKVRDNAGNLKLTPEQEAYSKTMDERDPWLWEKSFGLK